MLKAKHKTEQRQEGENSEIKKWKNKMQFDSSPCEILEMPKDIFQLKLKHVPQKSN